jgi:hypothetical protein
MIEKIVPFNHFVVSSSGSDIRILNPPMRPITYDEALNLAAYLVASAGGMEAFQPVYDAVCEA